MTQTRKVGRPTKKTDVRDQLIIHARELFSIMPYEKVSIRLIAQKARVDSAMVRYYFGNKEGLFETMLRESLQPMLDKAERQLVESSDKTLCELMASHYMTMLKTPRFSRLISQVMWMPATDTAHQLVEKVFSDTIKPSNDLLFERLVQEGIIAPDVDANLCRFSFISLMVFPFIAPPAMLALHGFQLTQPFIESLLEHNIRLLKNGMLVPASTLGKTQGTIHEN